MASTEHELSQRRREGLLLSLASPHPEAEELAATGLSAWSPQLAVDEELVDLTTGPAVRWIPGQGWVEQD